MAPNRGRYLAILSARKQEPGQYHQSRINKLACFALQTANAIALLHL